MNACFGRVTHVCSLTCCLPLNRLAASVAARYHRFESYFVRTPLRPNVLVEIDMDEQTNAESHGECKASTHTLNKQRLVWIPMGNRRMFIVFLVTLMQCFTVLWSERRQLNTTTMCPNNTFDHRHFPNMHHRFGARSPPEELTTSTSLHDWSIVVVKQ